tara:strand:+ start:2391 stop:3677 length:1287 start_codon:yes stop_codon:yes gene_type:complete
MINTNKVKLFEEFAAGEVSNPEQNVSPATKTTSDTVAVDKVAAEPQGAELRAEIIKDVDTILNNLEALSTRIQENIQNLSNDIKEGVEVDPLVIEAVQSLGIVNEADEPSKIMDILLYAPKARKAMKKVNKIKDNQMAMDLAADNLNARDEKEKPKKEKLQQKAKKAKEQADQLEKTVRDKFSDRGKIVQKAITKVDIDGQAARIKKLTGMEDDPKKKKALADQFAEIKAKQKEEEAAIKDLQELSPEEKKKAKEVKKDLEDGKAKDDSQDKEMNALKAKQKELQDALDTLKSQKGQKAADKAGVVKAGLAKVNKDIEKKGEAKESLEVNEELESILQELREGNAFGAARAEAIAKGEDKFKVGDEEYDVEGVDADDKENAEEYAEEEGIEVKEKEEATNEEEVEEASHPEVPHYLSVSEKMKMILKR